ncbi:MAG TPA: M23 family metallopeptidase [Thermoanaerobaculia bacterium]|nr:M23 family metallopeptidase [Thermoanaerobaculia bacterium]
MTTRQEEQRRGAPVIRAGLGGFLLGAATVLFVLWLYRSPDTRGVQVGEDGASRVVVPSETEAPVTPSTDPDVEKTPPPSSAEGGNESRPWLKDPPTVPSGDLAQRRLMVPVQGIQPDKLQDTYDDARGGGERVHQAMDIMAPQGTPVLAVEDGKIEKLFESKQGGLTIYQFDPSRTYAYYYAHLQRYADGLTEGNPVRKGQVIGYVGATGNANPEGPHLHFAIYRLTPEKQWWKGDPINPFSVLLGERGREERLGR